MYKSADFKVNTRRVLLECSRQFIAVRCSSVGQLRRTTLHARRSTNTVSGSCSSCVDSRLAGRYTVRRGPIKWLHYDLFLWDWATLDWATLDWATPDWATLDWATLASTDQKIVDLFSNTSTAPWGPRPSHCSGLHNHTQTHHTR
jgi:hypothetical protein